MQDKDAFTDMKRAKEEEYFRKKEKELIEKMRRRAEDERARRELAEASGIADEEIIRDLQELGYTRDTVSLLHLVPLVYVAWAEGSVSDRERELILEAARLRGITEEGPAHRQLTDWLEHRPPYELIDRTLRVIGDLLQSLPESEQQAARNDLSSYCTRVACASGGILGLGRKVSSEEASVLEEISKALAGRQDAVKRVIKRDE